MHPTAQANPRWKWGVCGLLLLATMINYMDRQTLSQVAKRVKTELANDDKALYGRLELGFGMAFAAGSVLSGLIVDRTGVRLYYPLMVSLWSAAGIAAGFARNYEQLMLCRVLLGVFEGANWPCALYTTQKILPAAQRTMGNGILQSGAAVGAIVTPLIVMPFLHEGSDTWRYPFVIVGAVGFVWVVAWLAVIRPGTIPRSAAAGQTGPGATMADVFRDRRFYVLAFVVIAINLTWHFFRAWLPLILQEEYEFSERNSLWFSSAYYVATDVGSLSAGALTLYLVGLGTSVHRSRMVTYLLFAATLLLSFAAAAMSPGLPVLAVFLVIGFAALGVFPTYYSFSQELTTTHQGKVTGTLGCICWVVTALFHEAVGRLATEFGYRTCIALAGVPPLLAFLVLLAFWKSPQTAPAPQAAPPAAAPEPEPAAS